MKTKQRLERVGFTLVELLLVLALVAVLAAILFAVFARVREKGRSTVCQSNLKQIAVAMQQYVQDSNGYYPPHSYVLNKDTPAAKAVEWNDCVMPYVKSDAVFRCPTSEIGREERLTDYTYNWGQLNDIVWSPNRDPKRNEMVGSHESKLLSSSTVVVNSDLSWFSADGTHHNGDYFETSCGSIFLPNLHSGGANLSFTDGHVKWFSQAQLGEKACLSQQRSRP